MEDSEAVFGLWGEGLWDGYVMSAMVHPGGEFVHTCVGASSYVCLCALCMCLHEERVILCVCVYVSA